MDLILASSSPRRAELLRNAGFRFRVRSKAVEETRAPTEVPRDYAARLARAKARAAWEDRDEIVLGADTIVVLGDRVFEKPADAEDAYEAYIGKQAWTDACIHRPGMINVVKIMHETQQLKTITEADVPKFADPQWCSN